MSGSARARSTPRERLRRTWLGLRTVTGIGPPGGYFLPYRYAGDTEPERGPYGAAETALEAARPAFLETLGAIEAVAEDLFAIAVEAEPPAPRWAQDWFPPLDAAVLYALLRRHGPRRLIEIGSGHSTRFALRALADGGLATEVTAIDPAPRADLEGLPLELLRAPVERAPRALFERLEPGDFLSIDSSHLLVEGGDVDLLLHRIVPALPPGVLLHVHDVFLPEPYPAAWRWRGYGEQLALLPLLWTGAARPLFAGHYVATRLAEALAGVADGRLAGLAAHSAAPPSSLWFTLGPPASR